MLVSNLSTFKKNYEVHYIKYDISIDIKLIYYYFRKYIFVEGIIAKEKLFDSKYRQNY